MKTKLLPPLKSLQAFEAAGRYESFLEAAAEQQITSGAISRHVRLLEQYLGTELFLRRSNGVTLTSAGRDYAENVTRIFRDLKIATDRVNALSRDRAIVISTLPIFADRWLYRRIPSFRTTRSEYWDLSNYISLLINRLYILYFGTNRIKFAMRNRFFAAPVLRINISI